MNTITAVRMALVLLMLCSGLFHATFATQRLRLFIDVDNGGQWSEASQICERSCASLVTVYDEEDAEFIYSFTNRNRALWLGLHYVGNYTWSNGDPVIFNQTSEKLEKGEQKCEAINDNKWQSFNCSEKKFFMCSKGNNYKLHRVKKTWCQALQHCRNSNSQMVSINSTEQNDEVIQKGNDSSFWIGLRRDEWKWDDDGCSSFREWKWNNALPSERFCTIMGKEGNQLRLYDYGCDNFQKPFCVTGHVRIKVINENKTWEEALNYCKKHHSRILWIREESDQEAVEQWLYHTDTSGPFWIGLRQSRVFGFWIWSDSVVVYSNWKDREPEPSLYNLCGVINTEDKKWREEDCLKKLPFLCEENIIYM